MLKLDIGCGEKPLPGYVGVDRLTGGTGNPLSINGEDQVLDASVDEIYASHILEHFSHRNTVDVLKEWVRALKPGGLMRIAVPDFDYCVRAYLSEHSSDTLIEPFIMGGHGDTYDHHGAIFNETKLREVMRLAGLGELRRWKSNIVDCASLPVSLNLQGVKGAGPYPILGAYVTACLSMPRLAFTQNMFTALPALSEMKIPTLRKSGVFWGQCLQEAFELALERDVKYLLTIDYDTVFHPQDIATLFYLMEDNPHADAVCAVQAGRDRQTVLMTLVGEGDKPRGFMSREEVAGDLLELRTGHFGLTLLRSAAVKELPKPWFMHQPDGKGGWKDGRIDDDIWFWQRFRKAGKKLFQANRVAVGHAQLVISWPNRNLETFHQYAADHDAMGKPEEAWR